MSDNSNNDELINTYIDNCINNCSDYNVSLTIFEILKDKHRYIGNKTWEVYDDDINSWVIDDRIIQLKHNIRIIVCDKFLSRSFYWDNISNNENINLIIDYKLKTIRLLQYSHKLQDEKYILTIIKEAKSLFYIDVK